MKSLNSKWIPLWVIPSVLILAVGTVWLRLAIVKTSYSINQAEKFVRKTTEHKQSAEMRVNALKSPRRLETLAKQKFSLSQPTVRQVVHLQ